MDLVENIMSRRTIHNYKEKAVEKSWLHEALKLALMAPNHKHTQPWQFFVLGDESRKKIVDLALQIQSKDKELTEAARQLVINKFSRPAYLVVVGRKPNEDPVLANEDYASMAGGLQNAALYLWEKGVGTKWSTGGMTRHHLIYELIDRSPNEIVLDGFFWVGYAEIVPPAPPKATIENCLFWTP